MNAVGKVWNFGAVFGLKDGVLSDLSNLLILSTETKTLSTQTKTNQIVAGWKNTPGVLQQNLEHSYKDWYKYKFTNPKTYVFQAVDKISQCQLRISMIHDSKQVCDIFLYVHYFIFNSFII